MAWYDDPNNTQGAAAPGSSSVPPGPPQVPGGQPQMPPPVQPQTPPGPPQGLGGPPQMGPPQGVHGDLPTSGGGNNNNKLLLVIAAVAVAAVVTIGGGIGAFMLLSGPEELSMSSYADKMCDEVIEPNREELVSLVESRRYEKRLFDRDIDNEDEAQEAIDLATENLDFREQLNSAIGSFNGDNIVSGSDGEELQEELGDYVESVQKDIDKAREVVSEADPSDEEDVMDELDRAFGKIESPSIYDNDRDPGYDLSVELADADDDCSFF